MTFNKFVELNGHQIINQDNYIYLHLCSGEVIENESNRETRPQNQRCLNSFD